MLKFEFNKKCLLLILIALFINCFQSYSQTIQYCYVPRDTNYIESFYVSKHNWAFAFKSNRRINKIDSSFYDSHIWCNSDSIDCDASFKKDSLNNWFIYLANKWILFYENKEKNIQHIVGNKCGFDVIPFKEKTIKNVVMYGFYYKDNCKLGGEVDNIYWFNPNFGIIAIENPSIRLVRSDIW